MVQDARVTARQRSILTAIVESYIATGEPVGSGTLARAEGNAISPATIRNEMAELADAGLLEQPHTSAGRVPSARAFRMYVEQLSHGAAARLPGLSHAQVRSQIDSGFAGVAGTQALLERTSHVLAMLSSGVGVAIGAVAGSDLLEHVHFSRLAERRVLALDRDLSLLELETAANFLNENFRGWNVERVRAELAQRIERERNEYQRLIEGVQQLWTRTVPDAARIEQTVYVEGVANLVGLPEDRERLREMLAALEAKQPMG